MRGRDGPHDTAGMSDPTLTAAQRAALRHVRTVALRDRAAALAVVGRALAGTGVRLEPERLVGAIGRQGRVTLNFHPDRLRADGRTVAEALATEGVYRSQFETRISNGGLTAYPGGDRDRWEERLFGGAYQRPGVGPAQRPKYGGLNLLDHPDGACPRFGSCHLRLRPEVLTRTTFCFGEFARSGEPLHAALIGRAAASVVTEPGRWTDRGPAADTLQQLKQLWHVLVRFGVPYEV